MVVGFDLSDLGGSVVPLLLFLLPSDNVQYDLQHGSLITFPKEENLRNKRKPMHQVYLPLFSSRREFFLGHVFTPLTSQRGNRNRKHYRRLQQHRVVAPGRGCCPKRSVTRCTTLDAGGMVLRALLLLLPKG